MRKSIVSVVLLSSLLGACSSLPPITDQDVQASFNRGELLTLYKSMQTDLELPKIGDSEIENRKKYIKIVGEKIAGEQEREIRGKLDSNQDGKIDDDHDIATLQSALEEAGKIEKYNKSIYQDIREELERKIQLKKDEIRKKEEEYSQLADKDAPKKVQLLNEIATIYGGQEAEQVVMQRTAYIDGLYQNAEAAMKSKRHEVVVMLIDNLEVINPSYPGIKEMRHRLISAEYEQQFWDALSKGRTDEAYDTFRQLTKIPNYLETHPDVVPIVEEIAQFFIADGDKQMGSHSIVTAYQAYSRARYIRNVMGKGDIYTPGELKFIETMDKRLQRYMSESATVPAYGYLSIIEELNPDHPSVTKYAQKINNAMLNDATIKLIPSAFTESESKRSLGRGIVSKINQSLMEKIPTRIQVIEGSKAATNYSTEQVKELPNPGSYYFFSGEILEAIVEIQERPASVNKRVLTSYKKVENPEYVAWDQLKNREKKKIPAPEATIEVPVEEDVKVKKTIIEKQGVFSITYRLADALNASVVFSDAMNKKASFTGENIEGIELGLFSQESISADLPSEADILEILSDQISTEAADKIAAEIEALEVAYVTRADSAVVSEDFNAAAANYGYSNVLLQARGQVDDEVLRKLRAYVIRWK